MNLVIDFQLSRIVYDRKKTVNVILHCLTVLCA